MGGNQEIMSNGKGIPSVTLKNIADWDAYMAASSGVSLGDRLIYDGIEYINLTGIQTSTTPNVDVTNWIVLREILRALEFLAPGNTTPLENDNWKLELDDIYLVFYRRQNDNWIEVFRTGASLTTDRFIINDLGGALVYDNGEGETRTIAKTSVDGDGVVIGNPNGRVAFVHNGELLSVNVDSEGDVHELVLQENTTETQTSQDFNIELTSTQVQAIISGDVSLANVPVGTKVRFSVINKSGRTLAWNVREFEYQHGGVGKLVTNGVNVLKFSEELPLPDGYVFKVRLEATNPIDIQGETKDLGDNRGPRFIPYLKVKYLDGVEEIVTTSHNIVDQLTGKELTLGKTIVTDDVIVEGNVHVGGAVKSTSVENLLVADSQILLNNGYQTVAPQMGGIAVNYLPTSIIDTVSAGAFVAGIAGISNPSVQTVGTAIFAQNDLVMVSASDGNNGLFEVHSHSLNLLTVRGIGAVPTVEGFTNNQFTANASDNATITKINVSILSVNDSGNWKQGKGSEAPIVFTDLGDDLWDKSGTTLQNKSGVDSLILNDGSAVERFKIDPDTVRLGKNGITLTLGPSQDSSSKQINLYDNRQYSGAIGYREPSPFNSGGSTIIASGIGRDVALVAGADLHHITGSINSIANVKKSLHLADNGYLTHTDANGKTRWLIDNTGTRLVSPDGTDTFVVKNSGVTYNDGASNDRIEFTNSISRLRSPNSFNYFQLDDDTTGLVRNGRFAFRSVADSTWLRDVGTNAQITIENGMTFTRDGTIVLIKADSTDTRLGSPDGNKNLIVDNNGISGIGNIDLDGYLNQKAYGDNTGLVLHFPFSEYGSAKHQYDYGSGWLTETIVGTPETSGDGEFGSKATLASGEGWSYEVYDEYPEGAADRTIEFRVKPSSVAAGRKTVFSFGSLANNELFAVGLDGDQAQLAFYGDDNNSGTTDFAVGEEALVHATYDGTTAKMYVNNVLKVSKEVTLDTGYDTVVIGGFGVAGVENILGDISQLKMYKRVLSEDEMKTPYLRPGGRAITKAEDATFRVFRKGIHLNDGTIPDRLVINEENTLIKDRNGYAKLALQGGALTMRDSDDNLRFNMQFDGVWSKSPNGNSNTVNKDAYSAFEDANRNRVYMNPTESGVVSPDGGNTALVKDDRVVFTGDVEVTDEVIFFGEKDTDGSWRIKVNGSALDFDRRSGGTYSNVGSFS